MLRLLIPVLLLLTSLHGTVFLPLDSTSLQNVELSSQYQNRIAVQGQRISKVIYPESDLSITLDSDIGQVFVFSLTDFPEKTTISVVTDGGDVQDIELSFENKPSEIVVLESICHEVPCFQGESCGERLDPWHPDYMVMVVEGIISGKVPEGFVSWEISPECRRIKKGVHAILVSKLVSLEETIYVWRIENNSIWSHSLTEKEMNFQCGSWVYLDKNTLGRNEQMIGIVSVRNRG